MPELPCFTPDQKLGLEVALATVWDDLRLGAALGCSGVQAARYFVQHLDASIPYLQRLAAGAPEEPPTSPGLDVRVLPAPLQQRLDLTLLLAARLQSQGYAPSDAIQTASLLVSTR
jgi:hypothetical protein